MLVYALSPMDKWECGLGPFVTPQPLSVLFPALAAHLRFMDESCCKATSSLLTVSVAASGEEPALPSLSPGPGLSRPQRRAVCKAPYGS